MLLLWYEIMIANLEQSLPKPVPGYMPRGHAYQRLKTRSGEDFGYDVEAWKRWLEETDPYDDGGKFYWNDYTAKRNDASQSETTDDADIDTPKT